MILPLFRRKQQSDTIAILYGMIVAQARLPCFYRDYGVADTVNGRFELIVLHMVLFLRRVTDEAAEIRALGQDVFDLFCQDMDCNLREIGIGDLAIPKEMRRIGDAFYGRAQAYEVALASSGELALVETVARNIFGVVGQTSARPAGARRLAAYMRAAAGELTAQRSGVYARAELRFPDPASVAVPAALA